MRFKLKLSGTSHQKTLIVVGLVGVLSLRGQAAYVGIHAAAAKGDVAQLKEYLATDARLISRRNGPGRNFLPERPALLAFLRSWQAAEPRCLLEINQMNFVLRASSGFLALD